MDAPPILPSSFDLERQRLESTLDHDLSSLSLSMTGTTSTSFASSSLSTIPVGRAAVAPMPQLDEYPRFPTHHDRTPRAFKKPSYDNRSETSVGMSPASTAGHHISAVTLGASVFRRPGADMSERTEEFDPDRSLGRLTRELARTMQKEVSWTFSRSQLTHTGHCSQARLAVPVLSPPLSPITITRTLRSP